MKLIINSSMLRDANDIELKIWQQERDFWMPRIMIVLTTNSILFLGFVQIKDSILGLLLCLLAAISNLGIGILYLLYERKFNKFEDRIRYKLPSNYNKKHSKKAALGRNGYIPVIGIFLIMWAMSFCYSYSQFGSARQQFLDLLGIMRNSIQLIIASILSIIRI
jgi:hypothetical protein